MNKLSYNYVPEGHPPHDETSFRIQASAISSFFDHTNSWYREKLLGEVGFTGNTASVLGTALHWTAENYIKDGSVSAENKQEMYDYVMMEAEKQPDLVEEAEIRSQLTQMWPMLREYIDNNPGGLAEPQVTSDVLPGITVGGSIDLIRPVDDTTVYTDIEQLRGMTVDIIDWKTSGTMSPPTKMSKGYEWQLLVYAYVLKTKYSITVRNIVDVFITKAYIGRVSPTTGKPMKDYYPTIGEVAKPVTDESLAFIRSLIEIVAHSVESFVTTPGVQRGLLAQDARLLTHTDTLPFTSIGQSNDVEI